MQASSTSLSARCSPGLPQWPPGYNPTENFEAAKRRQATVLRLMAEHGAISAGQAQEAREEGVRLAGTPFPIRAPHFVMYVQGVLESLLPAETVAHGGLRVVTHARSGLAGGRRGVRRAAASTSFARAWPSRAGFPA